MGRLSVRAMLSWLNAPLHEGSAFLGWAVPIAAAALLLLLGLLLALRRRKRGKMAAARPGVTDAPGPDSAGPDSTAILAGVLAASVQGIGTREEQQDAFGLSAQSHTREDGLLAVLCDGMGGMAAGGAIAQYVVGEVLRRFGVDRPFSPVRQVRMLEEISEEVFARYRGAGGATLVLAYILRGGLWIWSVGDSDILLLREGQLYALNARHEYRNELLKQVLGGELLLQDALEDPQADALSQYIGNASILCDYTRIPFSLQAGDTLLLCSDGVSDTVPLQEIAACMALPAQECCAALEGRIQSARLPEQDNYTAIVLHINTLPGGTYHGNHA